jgi:UDP-N-acetylglucosamine 2-epimerase (non-hydrolysing)
MLDPAPKLFRIAPDIDLDLLRPKQTLSDLGARVLSGMDKILAIERPDWIPVQSDTTTVATAAIVARYREVRVGHLKVGLRTGDPDNPFSAEMNRKQIGHTSDLFCHDGDCSRQYAEQGDLGEPEEMDMPRNALQGRSWSSYDTDTP